MVDAKAFIALEESLKQRLVRGWKPIGDAALSAIYVALQEDDRAKAIDLATGLDLSPVFEANRPYLRYHTYACLFFGASRLTPDPKQTTISKGSFQDLVNEVADNFQYSVKAVENSVRESLLQLIANSGEDTIQKYDPNQPRDEQGRWTDDGVVIFEESLNFARHEMPQIQGKDYAEFLDYLKQNNVTTTEEEVPAASLKPAQREYNAAQVNQLPEAALKKSVLVSRDNYVLDGTNRWVRLLKDKRPVSVVRLSLTAHEALMLMKAFPKAGRKDVSQVGATVFKYDPDQPRIPAGEPGGGQWTTVGGFAFGSPNEDNLTFDRAVTQLKSDQAKKALDFAKGVKAELGLKSEHTVALGVWADGAEPSVMSTIYSDVDHDTLDYASALFGKQFNQKAVLNFKVDKAGADTLYTFDDGTQLDKAKETLDHNGIEFKTLALSGGKIRIVVYEQGGEEMINKVATAAKEFHGKVKLYKGSGRFVGGDGESREKAVTQYNAIIDGYESRHAGQRGAGGRLVTRKSVYLARRKAETVDRILGEFVSFARQVHGGAEGMAQLVSALHTSRVSAYGFTSEAEVLGVGTYAISAQLDRHVCPVCEEMHGKRFSVDDARDALDEILHTKDPEVLKELQAWPKQDAASLKDFRDMTNDELVEENWHIPPYHPNCRCLLVHTGKVPKLKPGDSGVVIHITTPDSLPSVTTGDMFRSLNLPVPGQKHLDFWNREVGMYPSEFLSSVLDVPQDQVALLDLPDALQIALDPDNFELNFGFFGKINDVMDAVSVLLNFNMKDRTVFQQALEVPEGAPSDAAKSLLASEMALYQRMGLSRVEIEANIDTGAYAWARYGFVPTKSAWDKLRREIEADLTTNYSTLLSSNTLKVLYMALEDPDPKALWVVSDMRERIGTESIGKLLLLEKAWRGFFEFDDDEALERLGHYLDL